MFVGAQNSMLYPHEKYHSPSRKNRRNGLALSDVEDFGWLDWPCAVMLAAATAACSCPGGAGSCCAAVPAAKLEVCNCARAGWACASTATTSTAQTLGR